MSTRTLSCSLHSYITTNRFKSINAIANIRASDGAIGYGSKLLFTHDLDYFRRQTSGHVVLMGRLTAIPDGGNHLHLPTRELVIASRSGLTSIGKADNPNPELYIAGGEQIYRKTLLMCNSVYLTRTFGGDHIKADKFFPMSLLKRNFVLRSIGSVIYSRGEYKFTHELWVRKP